MRQHGKTAWVAVPLAACLMAGGASALAHHSFAMYDQTVTKTLTGKLTRFIPGGNHAQLIFELMDPDGKPIMDPKTSKPQQWVVETGSAMAIARQGVTVDAFPPGTVITVSLHPLRDGRAMGAISGPMIKCGNALPRGGCNDKTGQVMTPPAN